MRNAAKRLQMISKTEDQGALIEALTDPSNLVVEAAAKRINQPRAAAPLLRAYQRLHEGAATIDPGCWGRAAILEALGRLEAPEGEDAARLAVKTVQVEWVGTGPMDTATGLRVAGAGLLANRSAKGALLDLAILLYDKEPNTPTSDRESLYAKAAVRAAAARSIGVLGVPEGAAVLAVKLAFPEDELAEVLAECMDALVALREPRLVEILSPWLDATNSYLVTVAATALASSGGEAVLPLLLGALERAAPDAREPLVYAIAAVRAEGAREALRRLAEDEDPVVAKAAQSVL